jgi:hypothetical protein
MPRKAKNSPAHSQVLSRNPFRIGPRNQETLWDEIKNAFEFETSGAGRNIDDYEIEHLYDSLESFTRVRVLNKISGKSQTIDLRRVGERNEETAALQIVHHGDATQGGGILPQIEAASDFGWNNLAYSYVSPTRVLSRALAASLEKRAPSFYKILGEGSERYGVASHKAAGDESIVAGGLIGALSYSGQSQINMLYGSVNIQIPGSVGGERVLGDIRQEQRYLQSLGVSMESGMLRDFGGAGYQIRTTSAVPRAQRTVYDPLVETDAAGIPRITGLAHAYTKSGEPLPAKAYKHGQAAFGPNREVAMPMIGWTPAQPSPFEFELKKSRGVTRADYPFYSQLRGRFEQWEQQEIRDDSGNIIQDAAPLHNVKVGLQLFPNAVPFESGSQKFDPTMRNIDSFAIQQPRYMRLPGIQTIDDLTSIQNLSIDAGRVIGAGHGSAIIGQLNGSDIRMARRAREQMVVGGSASLVIPPYMNLNPQEGESPFLGTAPDVLPSGSTIKSTEELARNLSERLGMPVYRREVDAVGLRFETLSKTQAALKFAGLKTSESPVISGLPIMATIGGEKVRVSDVGSEIKTAPLMVSQSFMMFPQRMKANWAGLLGSDEFTNWVSRAPENTTIDEYARQYSGFSGKRTSWLEMVGQMYRGVLQQPEGLDTLKKYGYTPVKTPQWVNWDLMSEGEVAIHRNAMREQGYTQEQIDQRLRFTPDPKRQGMYQASFFMQSGLLGFGAQDYVPELEGWGIMNYRQVAAMKTYFPEAFSSIFAGRLATNELSAPDKQGWNELLSWYSWDRESVTGEYPIFAGKDVSTLITRETAGKLNFLTRHPDQITGLSEEEAARIAEVGAGGLTELERMTLYDKAIKTAAPDYKSGNMLYYESSNLYIPGPRSIRSIDEFNEAGESTGYASKSWLSMFGKANVASGQGQSNIDVQKSAYRFRKMMDNRLSGKNIAKNVFGYDAPGMIFERYIGMGALKPNEVFLGEGTLRRSIESLPGITSSGTRRMMHSLTGGVSPEVLYMASKFAEREDAVGGLSKALIDKYPNLYTGASGAKGSARVTYEDRARKDAARFLSKQAALANAYIPSFSFRQPDTSRGSVLPTRTITAHQLAARGIDPKTFAGVNTGISSWFSAMGVGDWDRDPMQTFFSVTRSGNKYTQHLSPEAAQWNEELDAMTANFAGRLGLKEADVFSAMEGMFGDKANDLNIVSATLKGYMDAQAGGAPAYEKGLVMERRPYSEFGDLNTMWGSQKRDMGSVYNIQRLIESAAGSVAAFTGENEKTFVENVFDPNQAEYQAALDFSRYGKNNPLFTMLTTARFFREGGGQAPNAKLNFGFYFDDPTKSGNFISAMSSGQSDPSNLVNAMIGELAIDKNGKHYMSNSALASLFSPNMDAFSRNVQALDEFDRLKAANDPMVAGMSRAGVLRGDFIGKHDVLGNVSVSERSIAPMAIMATGVGKSLTSSHEKYATTQAVADDMDFGVSWMGSTQTMSQIFNSPEVYLTNMINRYQRKENLKIPQSEKIMAISAMRTLAGRMRGTGNKNEPLTDDALAKMPIAVQELARSYRQGMGDQDWLRYTQGTQNIDQLLGEELASMRVKVAGALMTGELGTPMNVRTSELSGYIRGDARYKNNPLKKMQLSRMGYNRETIESMYPFRGDEGKARSGNEFESQFAAAARQLTLKSKAQGAPAWGGGTRFAHVGSGAGANAGGYLEMPAGGSTYRGFRMSISPDIIGWDPDAKRFYWGEAKYSRSSDYVEQGKLQNALYVAGATRMANDPGNFDAMQQAFYKYLSDDPVEWAEMHQAIAGGQNAAFAVTPTDSRITANEETRGKLNSLLAQKQEMLAKNSGADTAEIDEKISAIAGNLDRFDIGDYKVSLFDYQKVLSENQKAIDTFAAESSDPQIFARKVIESGVFKDLRRNRISDRGLRAWAYETLGTKDPDAPTASGVNIAGRRLSDAERERGTSTLKGALAGYRRASGIAGQDRGSDYTGGAGGPPPPGAAYTDDDEQPGDRPPGSGSTPEDWQKYLSGISGAIERGINRGMAGAKVNAVIDFGGGNKRPGDWKMARALGVATKLGNIVRGTDNLMTLPTRIGGALEQSGLLGSTKFSDYPGLSQAMTVALAADRRRFADVLSPFRKELKMASGLMVEGSQALVGPGTMQSYGLDLEDPVISQIAKGLFGNPEEKGEFGRFLRESVEAQAAYGASIATPAEANRAERQRAISAAFATRMDKGSLAQMASGLAGAYGISLTPSQSRADVINTLAGAIKGDPQEFINYLSATPSMHDYFGDLRATAKKLGGDYSQFTANASAGPQYGPEYGAFAEALAGIDDTDYGKIKYDFMAVQEDMLARNRWARQVGRTSGIFAAGARGSATSFDATSRQAAISSLDDDIAKMQEQMEKLASGLDSGIRGVTKDLGLAIAELGKVTSAYQADAMPSDTAVLTAGILTDIIGKHGSIAEAKFKRAALEARTGPAHGDTRDAANDYFLANAEAQQAREAYAKIPSHYPMSARQRAAERRMSTALDEGIAHTRLSMRLARTALAGELGEGDESIIPESPGALQAYAATKTGLSREQIAEFAKYKATVDAHDTAKSAKLEYDTSRVAAPWQGEQNKQALTRLGDFNDKIKQLGDTLEHGTRYSGRFARDMAELTEAIARDDLRDVVNKIGRATGIDPTDKTPEQMQDIISGRMSRLSARMSRRWTPERQSEFDALESYQRQLGVEQQKYGLAQNALQYQSEDYGMGGFFRRAFGGFGLLYMRGIASNIFGGLRTGREERLQQEQQIYSAIAPAFGGVEYIAPEQRAAMARGLYGGSFSAWTSNISANIMQRYPGMNAAANVAQAGIFGFAGASWLASLSPALAGIAGGTLPFAGVAAGIAAAGTYGMGIYSAYSDVEGTAVGMASRYLPTGLTAQERYTSAARQGGGFGPYWSEFVVAPQGIAWLGSDSQRETTSNIEQMIDIMQKGGVSPAEAARKVLGIGAHRNEIEKYVMMYTRATRINSESGVDIETAAKAVGLGAKYGIPEYSWHPTAASGLSIRSDVYAPLGAALQAGINVEGLALGVGQAAGWSPIQSQANVSAIVTNMMTSFGGVLGAQMTSAQADILQAATQRYAQLGPYAGMPGSSSEEQLAALRKLQQFGALGSKQWDIYQREWTKKQQEHLEFGKIMPTADELLDELSGKPWWASGSGAGEDMGTTAYTAQLRQYAEWERKFGAKSKIKEVLIQAGFEGDDARRIVGGLGEFTQGRAQDLLQRLSAVDNIRESLVSGRWKSQEEAREIAKGMLRDTLEEYRRDRDRPSMQEEQRALRTPDQWNPQQLAIQAAALRFDQGALAYANANQMNLAGMGQVPFYLVGQEVGQFGPFQNRVTGQPLFSTTMQWGRPGGTTDLGGIKGAPTGLTAEQVAAILYGTKNWQQQGPLGGRLIQGMVQGVDIGIQGIPQIGGLMAAQFMMAQASYQNQMASIGNSMAQLNLQYAFQTGVGLDKYSGIVNPQTGVPFGVSSKGYGWNIPGIGSYKSTGGGFWGLEDASRALGYAQQEWQFGQQEKQMQMQERFFNQNMGLQTRQAQMQRNWTQQDWAFQSQVRGLEWQWKQEDFQEEVRFMTGRERKKAERGMERETIMYGLEGEQIDKQKKRQQELWKLEDERFTIQRQQHQETMQFQREQLATQIAFFQERKKIEDEQVKLQRAQWTEQMKLQREALGIQAKQAKDQKDYQDLQLKIQTLQVAINTGIGDSQVLSDELWKTIQKWLKDLGIMAGNLPTGGGGGSGGCFIAGTPIATPAGNVLIEDISVGDQVYSYDENNREITIGLVDHILRSSSNSVYDVSIGGQTFRCTWNHPWLTTRGWVKAKYLAPGDTVLTMNGSDISETEVESSVSVDGSFPIYNFEVAVTHTYFADQYVVHNIQQKTSTSGGGSGTITAPPGSPASGGIFNGRALSFASGGFTVPPGYPNDLFQLWASSGERVTVTPRWANAAVSTKELQNPWNSSLMLNNNGVGGGNGNVTIVLNVGDQHLGKYVLNTINQEISL